MSFELETRLRVLECENRLLRLEKDWEKTREKYQSTTRYGEKIDPSHSVTFGTCFGVSLVGIVVMVLGLYGVSNPPPARSGRAATPAELMGFIALAGLGLIVAAIAHSKKEFVRVTNFEEARATFERERAEAEQELEKARRRV